MKLVQAEGSKVWRLEGRYNQSELLKIKQKLSGVAQAGSMLDISKLQTINAPIIALLLELRRHSDSLTLLGCRDDYKEMLQLYGVEDVFLFA